MTAVDETARVLLVEDLGSGFHRAVLHSPEIAGTAKPLQFVMVKVRAGIDPYLRRPFSLSLIDAQAGLIGLTWSVVGAGTEAMAAWEPGQTVSVLGPLGNGFDVAEVLAESHPRNEKDSPVFERRLFLLAGGTGLAPMFPLATDAVGRGWQVFLFYGARTASALLDTAAFESAGCRVLVSTDDGSSGARGFVTDVAAKALPACPGLGDVAVACGPAPMLRAAKKLCRERGLTLYVSLEQRMACGTGLCRGCAVKAGAEAESQYLHVCLDGPVFRADRVDLG